MGDISRYTAAIKNAVYGEEVRDSIIDAMNVVNADSNSAMEQAEAAASSVSESAAQIETNRSNIATNAADITDLKADLNNKVSNIYDNTTRQTINPNYPSFYQQTIDDNGKSVASDIRIRSGTITAGLTKFYKIVINSGYKARIAYYKIADSVTFVKITDYFTDDYITEVGYAFCIVIGKVDDSSIIPSEAPQTYVSYNCTTLQTDLDAVIEKTDSFPLIEEINSGSIPYAIASTSAYVRTDTGATTSNNKYERTDFIKIDGYDFLIYSRMRLTVSSSYAGIAFYADANTESFIVGSGQVAILNSSDEGYGDEIIKVPETAKYVRLSVLKSISGFYVKGIKSKPLKGLYLSILGASIETFSGAVPEGNDVYYTGSNSGIKSVNEIWWKVLCNNTGMIPLVIDAWSGSGVCYNYATDATHSDTRKIPMCSDLRTGRLSSNGLSPDVIIVAGGTNDWTYSQATTTPLGDWDGHTAVDRTAVLAGQSTFMESYASMIAELQKNYPSAIIVGVSMFFTWRGTDLGCSRVNDVGKTESDYSEAVEKICKIMGIPYINIYDVGFNYYNYYPTYCIDSETLATHPNALGHAIIAKRFIEVLPRLIRQFKS